MMICSNPLRVPLLFSILCVVLCPICSAAAGEDPDQAVAVLPKIQPYAAPFMDENSVSRLFSMIAPSGESSLYFELAPPFNKMTFYPHKGVYLMKNAADSPECFNFISLTIRPDGTLWKYVSAGPGSVKGTRFGLMDDMPVPKVTCISNGKSGNDIDLTDCRELNIEYVSNVKTWECNKKPLEDYYRGYSLAEFQYKFDYAKIKKDDPPLTGTYLGFEHPGPKDILVVYDGRSRDSSKISAWISNYRMYADHSILGDCNRDYAFDYNDLSTLLKIAGKKDQFDTICDMNGDRVIDDIDRTILIDRLGLVINPGDCNGDYGVDSTDIGLLSYYITTGRYQQSSPVSGQLSYCRLNCDMNGDNQYTQEDIDILRQMIAGSPSATPAPTQEPASARLDEQNGYFSGRLLTSKDFKEEQQHSSKDAQTQDRPVSVVTIILSIPQAFMSVIEGSPATETEIVKQVSISDTVKDSLAGSPAGSVQVVMNREDGSDGSGTMKRDNTAGTGHEEPAVQVVVGPEDSGQEQEQADTGPQVEIDTARSADAKTETCLYLAQNCLAGENACSGICVNMSMDTDNCGACGHACPSGWWCQKGECMSMLHMVTTEPTRPGQVSTAREHL